MILDMELGDVITFKDDVNAWVNDNRCVIKPGTLCTIVKIENDHEGMLIRLTLIMDNSYEARVYSISLCGIAPIKV